MNNGLPGCSIPSTEIVTKYADGSDVSVPVMLMVPEIVAFVAGDEIEQVWAWTVLVPKASASAHVRM